MDFNELDKRYVLRSEHEYQKLLKDVIDLLVDVPKMKKDLVESKKSSWRTERYLVGGLDDDGKYTMGMATWIKLLTFSISAFIIVWPLLVHYRVIP